MLLVGRSGFLPVMPFKSLVLHGTHHRSGPQLQIFVDSLVLYLYYVISIEICTSSDVHNALKCTSFFLAFALRKCARAIAITTHRFGPYVFGRLNSAHKIAGKLVRLPIRQILTLHVDISTLKKASADQEVREASALNP
jgi:hypothetical protein